MRLRYTFGSGRPRTGIARRARCVFHSDSLMAATQVPTSETTRWRAVARVLRSPLDSLSCTLLPASCALCGSPLPRLSSVPICDLCWMEFPLQTGPVCFCCGNALGSLSTAAGPVLCRACRLAPPPFIRAASYGIYQGRMREAIHALKYDRLHGVSTGLGRMLAEAIAQLAGEAPEEMLVVPVPLHASKYAQRGFNQSRSLARAALKFLRKSHPAWRLTLASSTLLRQRATETQAGLNPHERRRNVRGAFAVSDPVRVAAQNVLIIDDILTTGATARAAARALVEAGAASVWVATLARAQRGERFFDTEEEAPLSGALPEAESQAARSSTNGAAMPAF